jgi:multidrug efflux pump subunit AcrB
MKKQISSYLRSLKFDPKLWNTLQAKYLVNFRLVIVLIIVIVAIGISNFLSIPRRLNPEVKIPIVTVSTVLPGSNPNDVESLVTIPLEDKLNSLKGLDTLSSVSTEGISNITLQFVSSVNADKARSDTQALVDTAVLPSDAKAPSVNTIDFENQPFWIFIVKSKTDTASLMKFSQILKDRLEAIQKVDQVSISGFNEQEINIVIDPAKMKDYSISPAQLSLAISRATSAYPAGNISTAGSTIALSIDQQVLTIEDVRNIHLTVSGQIVKLSDIAIVKESPKPDQPITYYADKNSPAQQVVQFSVFKTSSANIDAAEKDAHQVVNDTLKEYKNKFEVLSILNTAEQITTQFSDLVKEFRSTILLVFINLLLFLGLRQAFISALTIPLSFFSAITIMNIMGLSLNFLTLFAFLIALGLLIDDTIVTVAAMTRYYSTGKFSPAETGLLVWRDFIVPLWSTTITTIWAFVPLLIATGIIGEYIKAIPIVVTATMLSSTTIAVLITIPLMIIILKPQIPYRVKLLLKVLAFLAAFALIVLLLPKTPLLPLVILALFIFIYVLTKTRTTLSQKIKEQTDKIPWKEKTLSRTRAIIDHGLFNTEILSEKYMVIIDRILGSKKARRTTITAIVIFAVVAYMLVPLGLVVNEFFPKADQEDLLYIGVELPAGTNINTTTTEALRLLNEVKTTPGSSFVTAEPAASPPSQSFSSTPGNTNIFTLTLHLLPKSKRISSIILAENLRKKYQSYTTGKLYVVEIYGGPPAGADIQIKLLGDDLQVLDQYADKLENFLNNQPNATNVDKSIKSGTSKLVFVPDQLKLAGAGLTVDAVSTWLRTYASGFTTDKIKLDNKDTDIVLRISSADLSPEEIGSIAVPVNAAPGASATGLDSTPTSVPLLSLGSFKLKTNPTAITRENGKRTISVVASTKKGASTTVENQKLLDYAKTLSLPPGYSYQTGGINEENQKSIQSILSAMVLSILLILVTMVIEFRSFRQALLTVLCIPLAIPGVFYIFALTGTPLSFPALIGVLALFGIVVTNAIVVVEKINDNRREGMPLRQSIVDASGSRLEPILLTSVTSILGLIPITLSDPLWRGLGGAIISGLLFSGIIKLFFVPITYYSWFQKDEDASGAVTAKMKPKVKSR